MYWEYNTYDESQVKDKVEKHNLSTEVVKLLLSRGIDSDDDIQKFLNAGVEDLEDPFDFERMEEVVEKVIRAKDSKSKVFIYGDYDVDGITASVYLTIVFNLIGIETSYYIPNRMDEGYGLNRQAIDYVNERSGKVIITVDTGINSVEDFEYAKSLGIDVIITDHHKIIKDKKEKLLVINPKLSKNYRFKYLSGAGVAFKVACAVYKKLGMDPKALYEHLDIVMIGTIADVMPLTDENRVIVKNGLIALKNTKIKGLRSLLRYLKLSPKDISTTDISFFVSPLLNALGRIGKSRTGADFFLEGNDSELYSIIEDMKKSNNKRRILERKIFNEINDEVEKIEDKDSLKYLFLKSHDWHPGVIGVVASRLSVRYNIPVILISLQNNFGKASCRSVAGINIFNILNNMSDTLIRFGGHDLAAGFIVAKDKLETVEKAIAKGIGESTKKYKKDIIKIDYNYPLEMVDDNFIGELAKISPFGAANPYPLFIDRDLKFVRVKKFGVEDKHFKTFLEKNGKLYSAVGFNLAHKIDEDNYMDKIYEIAYYPEKICYNNNKIIQIKIKDIKIKV
ncbi:single-stranded-DNA-specific exonuclease RecJ [Psychrilyobacter atlanticus]|uniref:single-stranded-DNA-specific exonuclease RecJ n=1 Tax=Psychrilyobacter atlanticus TaxID=271091 RepID=UPI000419C1E0|nr:single-stranded-DNA-specific exonuclease RecJ [Psychrilyobacter atlanticus]